MTRTLDPFFHCRYLLTTATAFLLLFPVSISSSIEPEKALVEKRSVSKQGSGKKKGKSSPARTEVPAALLKSLLEEGKYREAITEWERFTALRLREEANEYLAWELARAYVQLKQYDKAIQLYKPYHHAASASERERKLVGEKLIFGRVVAQPTKDDYLVGKGQCPLCHGFAKGSWKQDCHHPLCGPNLHGIGQRTKRLLASPEYLQRRKDAVQPEAFPGSGIATSVIEYLAESNVCPSCYVVPGFINFPDAHGRESPMPAIHKPPISLSRDELIAIDTWLLMQDGEEIPPVGVMRTAYDKFLPREDDRGSETGLLLASLYDAAGDLSGVVRLVEQNYPGVRRHEPQQSLVGSALSKWRDDPKMFVRLKERPELVTKFPELLQANMNKKKEHSP